MAKPMTEHVFMSMGMARMLATCDLHPSCNGPAWIFQWREIRYILRHFPKLGRSANRKFAKFSQNSGKSMSGLESAWSLSLSVPPCSSYG